MSWYLYGSYRACGYYSALYGYCSAFQCLEIKTACYFDKTQVVLFPFYRLKSEKWQTCISEVAQPLPVDSYQIYQLWCLDHSWCYRTKKLKQLFILLNPTYVLEMHGRCPHSVYEVSYSLAGQGNGRTSPALKAPVPSSGWGRFWRGT